VAITDRGRLLARALRAGDLVRFVSPSSTVAGTEAETRAAAQAFGERPDVRNDFAEHAVATHRYCAGAPARWAGDLPRPRTVRLLPRPRALLHHPRPGRVARRLARRLGWEPRLARPGRRVERLHPSAHDPPGRRDRADGRRRLRVGRPTHRSPNESVAQRIGATYEPDVERAVLVLETYRPRKRHVHALLVSLRQHGWLHRASGPVLGYLLGSEFGPGSRRRRWWRPGRCRRRRPLRSVVPSRPGPPLTGW
jgi:hypothetical protein